MGPHAGRTCIGARKVHSGNRRLGLWLELSTLSGDLPETHTFATVAGQHAIAG